MLAAAGKRNGSSQATMNYGSAAQVEIKPQRRAVQLSLVFAVIAVALIAAVTLISYARYSADATPVAAFQMLDVGNEYQVADALMQHATDKQFDLNPPVPDNIAALAKEAEDEMKIDAKVLATGKV